jgi:hypothetical protein
MSRARPFTMSDGTQIWFDQRSRATAAQLELLADIEDTSLDDLLDEALTQKQVLFRLREQEGIIPQHVLERRRKRAEEHGRTPACRICTMHGKTCEGAITRHHFVPRWLMLELDNYQSYASRSVCTIPLCVSSHRDLHYRNDGTDKTIVPYLRDHERKFAQRLLDELREEHPHIFDLIASGDDSTYEGRLIKDYMAGEFSSAENSYALDEYTELTDGRVASQVAL